MKQNSCTLNCNSFLAIFPRIVIFQTKIDIDFLY